MPFGRIVLGYHECRAGNASGCECLNKMLAGNKTVDDWVFSNNDYDWIGQGVYFWEYGPRRALQWAGNDGVVVGAMIQLGQCFDLTDPGYTDILRATYESIEELYREQGWDLPTNSRADGMRRDLDCLVVNNAIDVANDIDQEPGGSPFQTVRAAFEEGTTAFTGSKIRTQTHIQLAVRDRTCILGTFRPNFSALPEATVEGLR